MILWPIQKSSLAARLTWWYSLTSLLLLVSATGLLYWALVGALNRDTDLFLADKVHVLRAILRYRPNDSASLREEVELESAARLYQSFYIRLLDERGRAVLATPGMDEQLTEAQFPRGSQGEPGRGMVVFSRTRGFPFRALAATARVGETRDKLWTIQVAVDWRQEAELLSRYQHWLFAILGAALVLCPLVGQRIAHRGIRPLEKIVAMAQRIGSTTLGERIQSTGYPVELGTLAETFNAMLDRLEESFSRLSQFSADIAHELRTPVNNMRGETEVALARARSMEEYREILASNLEETVRLSELIDSLLFLARTESPGSHLERHAVEVSSILEIVRDYYDAAAIEAEVNLVVSCSEKIQACLDRLLIQRALSNLVSNALAHTEPKGTITLTAREISAALCLEVQDTGSGIPTDALPRVLDRFYRVDSSRSTRSGRSGLGLSIVQGIAKLHGGTVEITSVVGHGTKVRLHLPKLVPAVDPSSAHSQPEMTKT